MQSYEYIVTFVVRKELHQVKQVAYSIPDLLERIPDIPLNVITCIQNLDITDATLSEEE